MASSITTAFRAWQRSPEYASTSRFISNIPRYALLLGSGFCASHLFTRYWISWNQGSGDSMLPTIPEQAALAVTSHRYRHGRGLKLGDLVKAKNPVDTRSRVGKRVVGLPGDYVLKDQDLALTPGGARLPGDGSAEAGVRQEPVMIQVPEGHVWLAGDNMARSRDSRFYGAVPLAMIEGKYIYSVDGVFSWNSFRGEQTRPAGKLEEQDVEVKAAVIDPKTTAVD